ncbi:MAG: efflux RND transporter periplasmic adaptor subunit [Leptolyngbya sp.]|nr:efflux RND transporter periplasmic adaptor subunit [Leptolyngbya sp.]
MTTNRPQWPIPGKTLWILIVGALLLAGGAFWAVRSLIQARQAQVAEETAAPPPRQVQVAALGRVEPAGRVVDVVPPDGGRLARLLVAEGDTVATDQILAYLDLYEVRLAERDLAASQLAEAQALLEAQTAFGNASVQEARTRIDQIDDPQAAAIQAQQDSIDSLQAQLRVATADLTRFQQLYQEGAIARQDLDQQQATVDQLQAQVASAQNRKQELAAVRTSGLANAQAQVTAQAASVRLSQAQVNVESAVQNLALAEARLAQTIIRAPSGGQVLQVYAEPGEAIATSSPILALGNTDQMYVVAEVYETDIGLVTVGQPATITSRNGAFAQTLTGTVEQVGLQIFKNDVLDDDPAANADARVVEVRIRIDQSQVVQALTNLQVDVLIDVDAEP